LGWKLPDLWSIFVNVLAKPAALYRKATGRLASAAIGRAPQLLGRFGRPGQVICLITERCSAKCVHCDLWRNRGRETGPTEQEWRATLDEIRDWLGPIPVVFTGGEALLKPFTINLVAYATRLGLEVELLTHGYWRDQALIEALAMADPRQVTLSLDGLGATHDRVRGREGFFERTQTSIETLLRVRQQQGLQLRILLKTVIMSHNLDALGDVARFATARGLAVRYQPIEQNYGQSQDPQWQDASSNWPADTAAAIAAVERLIELKRQGLNIENAELEFERMKLYFRDPDRYRVRIQNHDFSARCGAMGFMQIQANGDVKACFAAPSIGNCRQARLRDLWHQRPALWQQGCCLEQRMSPSEKSDTGLR